MKDSTTKTPLFHGHTKNDFYVFASLTIASSPQVFFGDRTSITQQNERLGHRSLRLVQSIIRTNHLLVSSYSVPVCSAYHQSRSHALPLPSNCTQSIRPLQLIHIDVWGPSLVLSSFGFFFFYVSFVDDYRLYTWLYPLQHKSNAYNIFLQFQKLIENSFEINIKVMQFDWWEGGKFQPLQQYFKSFGIIHQISCPHVPHKTTLLKGNLVHRENWWRLYDSCLCPLPFLAKKLLHCYIFN